MKLTIFDVSDVTTKEEFHKLAKSKLNLPEHYGENLDALHDCLTDITEDERIIVIGLPKMREALEGWADTALKVLEDSADENPHIQLISMDTPQDDLEQIDFNPRMTEESDPEEPPYRPDDLHPSIIIEAVDEDLSVCKVEDYSKVDISKPFCFTENTDKEKSLICRTSDVPENTVAREDGWKVFRIAGCLDFTLIGILAGIADVLEQNGISIFAISTYDTDYIMTKEEHYENALQSLYDAGYEVR